MKIVDTPVTRCAWVGEDPLYIAYHDQEWGVPLHDDRLLFEFLVLEGAQAGLSWLTILKKRDGYREAFAGFDPAKVAAFGPTDIDRLLSDPGIVRNRLKVEAAVTNAHRFLEVQEEFGSFDSYVWGFVGGETIHNRWPTVAEIPAKTATAERLSADLKRRGFRFVGPTIMYAHMQATGMVNDHTVDCFRWRELRRRG
jgi:DNA-3-methyladenine glycosylase I